MAATKAAVKPTAAPPRNPNPLQMFHWEGTDKGG